MKKVLILGVNGLIGHHLSKRILGTTDCNIYGMDTMTDRITDMFDNDGYKSRMHFLERDIRINKEQVGYHGKKCHDIDALIKILADKHEVATGNIYNIGNPVHNYSIRDVTNMMLTLAANYPEYADSLKHVAVIVIISAAYYGKERQDVQNRVQKITNTGTDLEWNPTTSMTDILRNILNAYCSQVAAARALAH